MEECKDDFKEDSEDEKRIEKAERRMQAKEGWGNEQEDTARKINVTRGVRFSCVRFCEVNVQSTKGCSTETSGNEEGRNGCILQTSIQRR